MEVALVAVVMGISAWVVVPSLSRADDESRLRLLAPEMRALRAQIERYRVDHGGTYPSAKHFRVQMTEPTRPDGSRADPVEKGPVLGPYFRQIPINPYTGGNLVLGTGDTDPWGNRPDWYYDESTGQIQPVEGTSPLAK